MTKEDQKNLLFRVRCKSGQPDEVITERRDYPDRGEGVTWFEYEKGNNPWERSKHALGHQWNEWRGMQAVVTEAFEHSFLRSSLMRRG
ncbi:MAG: hypothetical protein CMP98_13745 [Gammaproteobacteria bacterium]|nr:hypothetical protein [Gammaproteobacteria bacterium]OUU06963.1 MAG: hypothetical protein CBB94_14435 [Gammaproteobacteria bacterium TMED34]